MPITDILSKNAELYGDDICLTEINPELVDKLDINWREFALVETAHNNQFRKEMTWRTFDERANQFAHFLLSRGVSATTKSAYCL